MKNLRKMGIALFALILAFVSLFVLDVVKSDAACSAKSSSTYMDSYAIIDGEYYYTGEWGEGTNISRAITTTTPIVYWADDGILEGYTIETGTYFSRGPNEGCETFYLAAGDYTMYVVEYYNGQEVMQINLTVTEAGSTAPTLTIGVPDGGYIYGSGSSTIYYGSAGGTVLVDFEDESALMNYNSSSYYRYSWSENTSSHPGYISITGTRTSTNVYQYIKMPSTPGLWYLWVEGDVKDDDGNYMSNDTNIGGLGSTDSAARKFEFVITESTETISPDFVVAGNNYTAGDVVTVIGDSVYVSTEDSVELTATDFAGNISYEDIWFELGHGIWNVCYDSSCITVMIYEPMIIIDNEINYFIDGDTLELDAGTEIKFANYLLYHEDGIYYSPDGAVLDAETDDVVVSIYDILYDTWTYQDEEGYYLEAGEYQVIVQWGICGGGFNQFFGTSNLYITAEASTPAASITVGGTAYTSSYVAKISGTSTTLKIVGHNNSSTTITGYNRNNSYKTYTASSSNSWTVTLPEGLWTVNANNGSFTTTYTVAVFLPRLIIESAGQTQYRYLTGEEMYIPTDSYIYIEEITIGSSSKSMTFLPDGNMNLDGQANDIVWGYDDFFTGYRVASSWQDYYLDLFWGMDFVGINDAGYFGMKQHYIIAVDLPGLYFDNQWYKADSSRYQKTIGFKKDSVTITGGGATVTDVYYVGITTDGDYIDDSSLPTGTVLEEGVHYITLGHPSGFSYQFAVLVYQPRFTLGGQVVIPTNGSTYFIDEGDSVMMNKFKTPLYVEEDASLGSICNEEWEDCYANVSYIYGTAQDDIHNMGYSEFKFQLNYEIYSPVEDCSGLVSDSLYFYIKIVNEESVAESLSPSSVSSGKFKIAINSGTVLNQKYTSASTVKYFVGKSSEYTSTSDISAGMEKYGVTTSLSSLKAGSIYSPQGLGGSVKLFVQIDSDYFKSGIITINSNGSGTIALAQVEEDVEETADVVAPVALSSNVLNVTDIENRYSGLMFALMLVVSMVLAFEVIVIKKNKKAHN